MSNPHAHNDIAALPLGSNPAPVPLPHFPTRLQAFLWRNWEMVPVERLAEVLNTTPENVLELAAGLGLRLPPQVIVEWPERGYLTLIRQNWHLLPYEQILQLIDWTPEQLLHALHEEDFLWIKMGMLKPNAEPLVYAALTPEQEAQTDRLRDTLQAYFPQIQDNEPVRPFDFIKDLETPPVPTLRVASAAQSGEVTLDGRWAVQWPRELRHATAFVTDFAATHKARWGHSLPLEGGSTHTLELIVEPDNSLRRESHRVEVNAEKIRIVAIDENGLLRGLQWLERQFEQRGGPHVAPGTTNRKTRIDLRLIHPYNAINGDVLANPDAQILQDGLLSRLSKVGVNGVWLQGILYQLYPWKQAPELSEGYEKRLEILRRAADRAADFGIGLYFYLNEPRCLPLPFYERNAQLQKLKGVEIKKFDVGNLCTSLPEVQEYLRDATSFIFEQIPSLAGVVTITMSENLTNCYSRPELEAPCPRCSQRSPADVVAEVNNIIAEGALRVKPDARVVAWTWAWYSPGYGRTQSWSDDAIKQLKPEISLQCTSEEARPTNVGGVAGEVIDYSISQPGPSPRSKRNWALAREHGLNAVAKVQFNNTWECSAVPYIPAFDLVREHLTNLEAAGVSGLMLSWTLGGYPSPNLYIASTHFWEGDEATLDEVLEQRFGAAAGPVVRRATHRISEAFREFPFHISGVYTAPYNYGPMNLLYAEPTGYAPTMIGFPYDGLDGWRAIYPREIYEEQFRKVTAGWLEGLQELEGIAVENDLLVDLKTVAQTVYLHYRSTYNQIAFIRRRDALATTTDAAERKNLLDEIDSLLSEEVDLACRLHAIAGTDSRIGFEASNHYYYTQQALREKVLNCESLREHYGAMS